MVVVKKWVEKLSAHYGFKVEEAMSILSRSMNDSCSSMEMRPKYVLPYTGKVESSWCMGIRLNHSLYSQCTMEKVNDKYCKTCSNQCSKNSNGKPTYGNIEERNEDYKDKNGKKAVKYGVVLKKLNISREEAEKEALKFNIVIPEEEFEINETKRGRPKKDVCVSDTDSDVSVKAPKKRGRPKKDKKMITTNVDDNLIADLVAKAKNDEEIELPKKEKKKPETKKKPVTKKKEEEKCHLELEEESDGDSDAESEEDDVVQVDKEVEEDDVVQVDKEVEEDEEDKEDEVEVKKFELTGKMYLKAQDNILYDIDNHEAIGIYNEGNKNIDELANESEDEI